MTESDGRTFAAVRRSRWPGWVWAIPIAAFAIVVWLLIRHFVQAGLEITITFPTAAGMTAEDTTVRYKGLSVGKVEEVSLSDDKKRIIVTAQMDDTVEDLLRKGTRFWRVGTDVKLTDLSTLKSIISGPYIAMEPGSGDPRRHFEGLSEAPVIQSGVEGTWYVLESDHLGSIGRGSPVSYRGLQVGSVTEAQLEKGKALFHIVAFIRAPYDKLVRDDSRFWLAGAARLSLGSSGIEAHLSSLQAMLSGMVAFDRPDQHRQAGLSEPGHSFRLHDSREAAMAAPIGRSYRYLLHMKGEAGGLSVNAPVELKGFTVGRVADVKLRYIGHGRFEAPVVIELDPYRLGVDKAQVAGTLDAELESMIENGLRAKLDRSPPLISAPHVAFYFDPNAEPAKLVKGDPYPSIPTAEGGDLSSLPSAARSVIKDVKAMNLPAVAADLRQTLDDVKSVVSSEELRSSLEHMNKALANLDHLTGAATGKVGPMVDSLRKASSEAERALESANNVLGGSVGPADRSVPAALEEITEAARSLRILANYLERHPEALIEGREQ